MDNNKLIEQLEKEIIEFYAEEPGYSQENVNLSEAWRDLADSLSYNLGDEPKDGLLGTAKVEEFFGGEGQGDTYYVVISIMDGNKKKFVKRDGWYASYDGGHLDGPTTIVNRVEKTIVVYE